MREVISLIWLCVFTAAMPAQADTVEIHFDFSSSTVNFLGQVTIPPDGSITTMGATVVVPAIQTAGGATVVQNGNAALKSLTMDLTMDAGAPLFALVTGTIVAFQVGTSTGSFVNLQTAMFGGTGTMPGMSFNLSVHLDCAGLLCGSVGSFPVSILGTHPNAAGQPFNLFLANLNTPGAAGLAGTMPINFPPATTAGSPFTGSAQLVGSELSRTFVPEPSFLAMLGPGLAGLAGLSLHRRHSRRVSG